MTRLSGVICGLTLSDSTAFLNWVVVAPEPEDSWYGISTPCSIDASFWFDVIRRGAETISPRPSACAADSSRSTRKLPFSTDSAIEPAGFVTRQRDVVARQVIGGAGRDRYRERRGRSALQVGQGRAHDRVVRRRRCPRWRPGRCCPPRAHVGRAELHAELAGEVVVDDHDARLDQHLADRDVEPSSPAGGCRSGGRRCPAAAACWCERRSRRYRGQRSANCRSCP